MKNLLWIPFREEGNTFLLGKKKIHNLHFHPQSFYAFVWSECEKQKQFLLWGSDIETQLLSAQLRWDRGQRYIFCVRFWSLLRYPPPPPPPPLGGRIREELSQQRGACPEGGLRRSLPCWRRALSGLGVQRWPRGSQRSRGASCGSSVDPGSEAGRWWFWGLQDRIPSGCPLCSYCTGHS